MEESMGFTHYTLRVRESRKSRTYEDLEFLIDSGSVYSVVLTEILVRLEVEPQRERTFTIADGKHITRQVGDAFFEFRKAQAYSPVVFREAGDRVLLGAVTLETLELVLNPLSRRLYPGERLHMK